MPGATITIKLDALTQEFNAKIAQAFSGLNAKLSVLPNAAVSSGGAINRGFQNATKSLDGLNAKLSNARMGLMELEHTARSTMDVLLMGGSPRMLLAQVPQMVQGLTMMGVKLTSILPPLGAVGAAVGAGALLWEHYAGAIAKAAEEEKKAAEAIGKLPKLLDQVNTMLKAGRISPAAANEFEDYLSGKKKLYRGLNGEITPYPTETITKPANQMPMGIGYTSVVAPQAYKQIEEVIRLEVASLAEAQDYVTKQLRGKGGIEDPSNAEVVKLRELEQKVRDEALSGIEREKAAVRERYRKEREELERTQNAAKGLLTEKEKAEAQAAIKLSHANEQAALRDVDFAAQQEMERKANESALAGVEERAKYVHEQTQKLEQQITADQEKEGGKRAQDFERYYQMRIALYKSLALQGYLTEAQETAAVVEANNKREEAARAAANRRARLDESWAALELSKVSGNASVVEQNPFLSQQQKRTQLIPIYQDALRQTDQNINDTRDREKDPNLSEEERLKLEEKLQGLLMKRAELEQKLTSTEAMGTWSGEFKKVLVDMQTSFGTFASQMAHSFASVFQGATQAIASNISAVINRTKSWGQALMDIRKAIGQELIQSIVQMGVQFVATQVLMRGAMQATAAIMRVLGAEEQADNLETFLTGSLAGVGTSAAEGGWTGVLIYMGVLAAAIGAVMAIAGGFAEGGWVSGPGGPKSDSILARLSNGEFVVPADKARAYAPLLAAIHNGTLDIASPGLGAPHAASLAGGGGGGSVVNHRTDVQIAQFGGEAAAERWARSQSGEVFFHDMMKQHAWKYQKRG